jgi:hypothetical protein
MDLAQQEGGLEARAQGLNRVHQGPGHLPPLHVLVRLRQPDRRLAGHGRTLGVGRIAAHLVECQARGDGQDPGAQSARARVW